MDVWMGGTDSPCILQDFFLSALWAENTDSWDKKELLVVWSDLIPQFWSTFIHWKQKYMFRCHPEPSKVWFWQPKFTGKWFTAEVRIPCMCIFQLSFVKTSNSVFPNIQAEIYLAEVLRVTSKRSAVNLVKIAHDSELWEQKTMKNLKLSEKRWRKICINEVIKRRRLIFLSQGGYDLSPVCSGVREWSERS